MRPLPDIRAVFKSFSATMVLICTSGCGTTVNIHPTVLFVGDSITHEWAQSYNGQQAAFAANNWLDVGVLGLTSKQIVGEFEEYIPPLQPKAVHIIAGTNDVYAGWKLSDTSVNIQTMVALAKARHIPVVLGTIPPWGPEAIAESADGSPQRFDRINQLNQWIIQFAAQQGITVVDYHAVLAAANGENYAAGLSFDGVHPSPTGYALMTPAAERALQAVIATPSP
jgi:lysophospholipase L1-like esterase